MEPGELRDDVIVVFVVPKKELLHLRCDEVGLYRFVPRAQDADRDPSIHAAVLLLVCQDERVDLFDDALAQGYVFPYELSDIVEGLLMSDRLHMILQRFLSDRKALQDEIRLPERQRIAFDRVGVIGVLDGKLLIEAFQFSLCQRPPVVQFFFLAVDLRQKALCRAAAPVRRFSRVLRDPPPPALVMGSRDLALRAKHPRPPVRDAPLQSGLFHRHIHADPLLPHCHCNSLSE